MGLTSKKNKYDIFVDEKFIPFDKGYKILILVLAFILPVSLFYFGFLQQNLKNIENLKKQIQVSTDELNKVRRAARDLPKHQKELEDAQNEFELTSVLLPKSQEIPNLLRNISDLGKNSGLDFISFVPGAEMQKDFYAEIPIDIKIKGPYHNLGLFLDKVSKLERIVTVNNIKTEKAEQVEGEMLLSSSCRLVTYRFTNVPAPPPEQKGKKGKK